MYRKKKGIFTVIAMMIMLLGITGCGKSTEDADQTGGSVVEAENLPASETGEDGEKPEEINGEEPEAGAEDEQTPGQENGGGEPVSGTEEGNTFHYIKEDKDLYGDICEIGENQFTVTEIYVETEENGGEIMAATAPGAEGEASKITVTYDENTKFIKQKIWDGGAGHEEKEGSAADLQKGFTAEMNGSYEGDVFHATEILIVEVILN